jgi:PBP1b-binding outer membrane lipoprotein LpoB
VVQQQAQTNTVLEDSAEVSKRVADADFFLTGLIYSTTEVAQQGAARGMRYFQFQFRLTNTQSNIIMWEKEYMVKREASFK